MNSSFKTFLKTLAPRLSAGFGTAALAVGVGLVASSRPARTAAGPIPVSVSNSTLAVTTDTTQQPFTAVIPIPIFDGQSDGEDNGNLAGTQTAQVPAGKRLIVQTCSCFRYGVTSGTTCQTFLTVQTNGSPGYYTLPIMPAGTAHFIGATQPMTFSVDGGSVLLANAYRSGEAVGETDIVTISGYLVPSP